MITGTKSGYKFLSLPEELIDRLRRAASRKGLSITAYSEENLEEALKAEDNGVHLAEAVESYRILRVQLAAGAIQIPRQSLDTIVKALYSADKEATLSDWVEAGKWYGEYLRTLFGEGAIEVIGGVLKVSWNLDEVEMRREEMKAELRFASFALSEDMTELLVSYIAGVMRSLGYERRTGEFIRGLAKLSFERVFHTNNGR
jgi:plasmid stability protein